MEHILKTFSSVIAPLLTALLTIIFALLRKKKLRNKKIDIKRGKTIGTYEGVDYTYNYSKGSGESSPCLTVSIKCQSSGSFRVTSENKFDRFFIKLGVCNKLKTGDLEFDNKFYITTGTEDFTRTFFSYQKNRDAVKNINNKGFFLSHNGKLMTAGCSNLRLIDRIDTAFITEIVSNLITLSKDIPPFTKPGMYTSLSGYGGWKSHIPVLAIPVILEALGVIALVFGVIQFKPLDVGQVVLKSLTISIPLLVIFLWLALRLLRGGTSSHIEFLIAFIISLTAFPIAGAGGLIFLNGWLDKSEISEHKAEVVDKLVKHSEDDTTYYVLLKSWRAKRDIEKMRVSRSLYLQLTTDKSSMIVATKQGRFGFEWLVRYGAENPDSVSQQQ